MAKTKVDNLKLEGFPEETTEDGAKPQEPSAKSLPQTLYLKS